MKKEIVIIGAGPAGLTAAYEILKQSRDYKVVIVEKNLWPPISILFPL